MPGDGMSMWPRLFLWLIIIERCWPGVHRLPSQLTSARRGIGLPEIWEQLTFRPILRYHALDEKIWLREENRLGDFARPKRLQNLVGTETAMYAA